jgi:large subunit ribosomal protein L18e
MISKTKINKRTRRKNNPRLVETIKKAEKNNLEIAKILSGPCKNMEEINLDELSKEVKENENIIIVGKVLGKGNLDKKCKIIALKFSEKAIEKLKNNKIEFSTIKQELNKNKKIQGRILKNGRRK